ncbi:MAG: hypothetical protein PHW04_03075 [Candidatus Wallbacteria bacterium]|nr:hypothetical protein [Candidatus Wallbacteria bacterium]
MNKWSQKVLCLMLGVIMMSAGIVHAGTFTSIVNVTVWKTAAPADTTFYTYLQGTFDSEKQALEAAKANTDAAVDAAVTQAMVLLKADAADLQYSVTYAASFRAPKAARMPSHQPGDTWNNNNQPVHQPSDNWNNEQQQWENGINQFLNGTDDQNNGNCGFKYEYLKGLYDTAQQALAAAEANQAAAIEAATPQAVKQLHATADKLTFTCAFSAVPKGTPDLIPNNGINGGYHYVYNHGPFASLVTVFAKLK